MAQQGTERRQGQARTWLDWVSAGFGLAAALKGVALLGASVAGPFNVLKWHFSAPQHPAIGLGLLLGGMSLWLPRGIRRARVSLLAAAGFLTCGILEVGDLLHGVPRLGIGYQIARVNCLLLASVSLASSVLLTRLPSSVLVGIPIAAALEGAILLSWGRSTDSTINLVSFGSFLLSLGLIPARRAIDMHDDAEHAPWVRLAGAAAAIATGAAVTCLAMRQGLADDLSILLGSLVGVGTGWPFLAWSRRLVPESEAGGFAGRWRWDPETDQLWLSAKLAESLGLGGSGILSRASLAGRDLKFDWQPPGLPAEPIPGQPVHWRAAADGRAVHGFGEVQHRDGRWMVAGAAELRPDYPPGATVSDARPHPPAPGGRPAARPGSGPGPTEPVALGPLLRRVISGLGTAVQRSGIELRLVDTSHTVMSEPVMLERALRLLMEGIIKTEGSFRVLVGCRRSHDGIRLLALWTRAEGGMDAADAAQSAPEITLFGRLAERLGHEVRLGRASSRVAWTAMRMPQAASHAAAATHDALSLGLICLDAGMRQQLHAILDAAGHSVIETATAEEMQVRLANGDVPDAVILDCRPFAWNTGREWVIQVRNASGWDIPAVLLAGPASAGVSQPERGIHVLTHPLVPGALHAALESVVQDPPWMA